MNENKKLVVLSTLFTLNLCSATLIAGDFKTHIQYPDLTTGKAFGLNTNSSHKLLFYTGTKDDKTVNGYFRSSHFLGWTKHNFHPLEPYSTEAKRIVAVADGPANHTLVLSHVDGYGQLISASNSGKDWDTKRILVSGAYFNNLTSTYAAGMHGVIAYGTAQSSYIMSNDSMNWYSWQLPNGCKTDECTFENKYLGDDGANKLVLIQTTKGFYDNNVLYHSTNYYDWYKDEVPFNQESIQHVFKAQHSLMAVDTVDKNKNHKLWLSDDLSNWKSFDLPQDATLADLVMANKRIELLLVHTNTIIPDLPPPPAHPCDPLPKEPDSSNGSTDDQCHAGHGLSDSKSIVEGLVTDHAYLDPETNSIHLIQQFAGEISHLKYLDDKLYLVGNFTNSSDNKNSILAGGSV